MGLWQKPMIRDVGKLNAAVKSFSRAVYDVYATRVGDADSQPFTGASSLVDILPEMELSGADICADIENPATDLEFVLARKVYAGARPKGIPHRKKSNRGGSLPRNAPSAPNVFAQHQANIAAQNANMPNAMRGVMEANPENVSRPSDTGIALPPQSVEKLRAQFDGLPKEKQQKLVETARMTLEQYLRKQAGTSYTDFKGQSMRTGRWADVDARNEVMFWENNIKNMHALGVKLPARVIDSYHKLQNAQGLGAYADILRRAYAASERKRLATKSYPAPHKGRKGQRGGSSKRDSYVVIDDAAYYFGHDTYRRALNQYSNAYRAYVKGGKQGDAPKEPRNIGKGNLQKLREDIDIQLRPPKLIPLDADYFLERGRRSAQGDLYLTLGRAPTDDEVASYLNDFYAKQGTTPEESARTAAEYYARRRAATTKGLDVLLALAGES